MLRHIAQVQDIRQRAELARAAAPVALHGCSRLRDGMLSLCGADGMVLLVDPTDLAGAAIPCSPAGTLAAALDSAHRDSMLL